VNMAGEITSLEDYDMYYASVTNNSWYSEVCGYSDNGRLKTWLPYVVNSTGTGLVHVRSGSPLFGPFYASWYPGPQGPSPSDVGAAYYGLVPKYENVVGDKPTARKCTACALHDSHVKTSTVTLRGLCRYSSLDTKYQVQYTPELGIAYYGEERTSITFSRELSVWQIADMSDPTITAVSEAPFRSLALGISTWTVHNDTGCSQDSMVTQLALTSCGVEEFTCWDGVCLPLDQRCDGRPQCRDSTDEMACSVLDLNPSYNRFLAPPSPAGEGTPLEINVSIDILAMSNFDPIQGNYETKFTLSLEWLDSRLSYNNLRSVAGSNRVDTVETGLLWFPAFVFQNTKDKNESVVDNKATMEVVRRGAGAHNTLESTENKVMFPGTSSSLLYSRYYSQVFECSFDLKWFPFDIQACTIQLSPVIRLKGAMVLLPTNFTYSGPTDLTQFTVKSIAMMSGKQAGNVVVNIVIQRRLLSIVLTTFVPTIILNIIGHMSNYFKEFFFEGLMSLNVTVMLVLTTLFISVSASLPPTAYIKMIDVWLIFNLLKPFIDIIVQTYIESLREADGKEEDEKKEKMAWVDEESPVKQNYLRSKDEKNQQKAMTSFYAKAAKKNEKKIRICKMFARTIYPMFCIIFVVLFWATGMVVHNKES